MEEGLINNKTLIIQGILAEKCGLEPDLYDELADLLGDIRILSDAKDNALGILSSENSGLNIPVVDNRYLVWKNQVVRLAVRGNIIKDTTKLTSDFMKIYFDDGYTPAGALDDEYGKDWRQNYNGC